jgi:uncharacterized metal-binding protein
MKTKASSQEKVIVIPCSGIGKAFGSISRDAVYEVIENLRKDTTQTLCLALLVSGDEESLQLVRKNKCITVDGCPLQCAQKNVELAGGNLAGSLRVVDVYKDNRHLKPRSVTFLDPDGQQMALVLAEKVAKNADELLGNAE